MNYDQLLRRFNSHLETARNALCDWLNLYLPKISSNWWEECVADNLNSFSASVHDLKQLNLSVLLKILNNNWFALGNVIDLSVADRECVHDMMNVCSNWSASETTRTANEDVISDLKSIYLFQGIFDESDSLEDINQTIDEVNNSPLLFFNEDLSQNHDSNTALVINSSADEEDIEQSSVVYLTSNPETRGVVMSISDLGDTKKYQVFVNGSFQTYYSGQIARYIERPSINWVDINTFRSALTAYLINNPSGNDLYSLNAARIDFVPYQFRPALKLIHADEPKILIADSVGVGKTIEAGLIIKELQARNELENILIICPKPLVTERKWEMEMKRFDEDFVSVDGPTLRQIISDTDRDGEWPIRFNKVIIPYSILDSRTYEGEHSAKSHSFGLRNLDPEPHFDLVIVDEAHHIRNGSMEKEKAFEYKCVKYFCDRSDAVVMLTATPLQTSDNDLFTLLNILRPDIVIDKETFNMMSLPNAYVSKASQIIRQAGEDWKAEATDALREVLSTRWGTNVIADNPVYKEILKTLSNDTVSREERVRLITEVESLHSFNSMLNRTRRKDIQDFCIRRPYTLAVPFTEAQKALHDELLQFEREALTALHGNPRSIPFMMSTIKRQAASCIFGLAPHIRDMISRRFEQIEDNPDVDLPIVSYTESDLQTLKALAEKLLYMADHLPSDDPKYDCMLEAIRKKQLLDNNKIIIFSTFRHTLKYLRKKLQAENLRVAQVDGSVKDVDRQELRKRFELPKSNPEALDILLFTEVGSEGLDYQFCDMMINYDLPWNPMRIEQRIGRIDRRGQRSEAVSIYNMITDGTVDADIYYRCLMRIGIFENSIGECDEVLGEIATQLDQIAMDSSLTDEERRLKLEQMADNEVRKLQELNRLEEEEKEFFGFDLSEYMTSQQIQKAENPWLSQRNLLTLINQYLNRRIGQGNFIRGEGDLKQLRLSFDARAALREDFRRLPGTRNLVRQTWDFYLKGKNPNHPITFVPEAAERNRDAFLITPMHPLAKQAAAYFRQTEPAYIRIEYCSDHLPAGNYYFSVYAWKYIGINPHFKLVIVSDNNQITESLPDILQESSTSTTSVTVDPIDWDELEKMQVKLWADEKESLIQDSKKTTAYKIESLTHNFTNTKKSLEQRIDESDNANMRRMYISELENNTEKYEKKINEIQQKSEMTDIHSTLIANGILNVIN